MKKRNFEDGRIVFDAGVGKIRDLQKNYTKEELKILAERERLRREMLLAKKELAFWEGGIWGFTRTTALLCAVVFGIGFWFNDPLRRVVSWSFDPRIYAGASCVITFLACWNMFDFGRIKLSMYMLWHERGTVDDVLNELCNISRAENAIKKVYEVCQRGKEDVAFTSSQIANEFGFTISNMQIGRIMAKLKFHKKRVGKDRLWLLKRTKKAQAPSKLQADFKPKNEDIKEVHQDIDK